ncbi:MAG: sigma-70 family RNA polymerase sigma factor [Limisphaerales bacterium]
MPANDFELLQEYARNNSDAAFASLVARHLNLVYSAALRQVRSSHLAEEIAQSVFLDLSRSAKKLKPDTLLSAWLFQTTRRTAINVWKQESRRQLREQTAVELAAMNSPESEWTHIEPLLDEAMDSLSREDRDALLLRFFENKSLREVGENFGASEDAAQKRVSRAVEQLRKFFTKRGVAIGSASFAALLSANVVQAAPIGLGATISSAISVAAISSVAAKTLIMTTTQKILIATTAAVVIGTGVYEAMQISDLHKQVEQLHSQQKPLIEQIAQLQRERDEATNQLAIAQNKNTRLRHDTADIYKLRGDVTRLQRDSQELAQLKSGDSNNIAQTEMKSWLARVNQLKKRLAEFPDQKIPELQFVTEQDWLDAAHGKLETDKDIREALSRLRGTAEHKFVPMIQFALKKYMEANQGKFPTDVLELQSYFKSPIDSAVFQRYEIVLPNSSSNGRSKEWNITQKAPVGEEFDGRDTITADSWGSSHPAWQKSTVEDSDWKTLSPLRDAYKAAYGIIEPSDYSLLKPFVTTPEQQAALEKLINETKQRKTK